MQKSVEIYVPLKDEGTPTIRPTQAIPLGNDLYKILPTPDYDPEDETWEFLPGSVVRCDHITLGKTTKQVLRAYAVQDEDGSFTLSKEIPDE